MALTAANEHEPGPFMGLIAALPAMKERCGYRRKRRPKVHTEQGYDVDRWRTFLRRSGGRVRLARRGSESSKRPRLRLRRQRRAG